MMRSPHNSDRQKAAFTLIELLVSMAVLVLLLALLVQMIGGVQGVVSRGKKDINTARKARNAIEFLRRDLNLMVRDESLPLTDGGWFTAVHAPLSASDPAYSDRDLSLVGYEFGVDPATGQATGKFVRRVVGVPYDKSVFQKFSSSVPWSQFVQTAGLGTPREDTLFEGLAWAGFIWYESDGTGYTAAEAASDGTTSLQGATAVTVWFVVLDDDGYRFANEFYSPLGEGLAEVRTALGGVTPTSSNLAPGQSPAGFLRKQMNDPAFGDLPEPLRDGIAIYEINVTLPSRTGL